MPPSRRMRLKSAGPHADTTSVAGGDNTGVLCWVVESSADGVAWERLWIGTAGCFSLAQARQLARSCQAAHDILEWTCGLPPKTWRLRNVRTGTFIVGDDAPDGRH